MTKTIDETFRDEDLPRWARKYPEVVRLARENLAFRCDLLSARTRQYQRALIRIAQAVSQRRSSAR
jgi:hypothetical protein